MELKKQTIIKLEDGERYVLVGRIKYMDTDYFPACKLDNEGQPIEGSRCMCYEEFDDDFDPDLEDLTAEDDVAIDFVEDDELEKLLWLIYSVREDMCKV